MTKKHVRCIQCGSLNTKRNGTRKTKSGRTKRFMCLECKHSFNLRLQLGKNLSHRVKVDLARRNLEGRTSIRTIARHTGYSKTTVCKAIHDITKQCVGSAWIAKELQPKWGGYLALDGKMIRVWDWSAKYFRYNKEERRWLHKMSLLIALDLETLDIPTHHLGDEETTIDLVLMLRELKDMNYPLKGYVTDGNEDIKKAVELVFGKDIPRQLCTIHYLRNLNKKLNKGDITNIQYRDVKQNLHKGLRPKLLKVPDDLFTYQTIKCLPWSNQQIENLIRYFNLRLKTLNQFHDLKYAKSYLNTLTLMRRFTRFTDCSNKDKNLHAPLELAGCDITNIDYLRLKSNRKMVR